MIIYENHKRAASEQIGIKACSLIHLQKIGMETPEWFALGIDCFHDFIYDHRDEYFSLLKCYTESKRQKFVSALERTEFTDETKDKIIRAIHKHFAPTDTLAIRTSITDADLNAPYIGMYQTYLFVKQNEKFFTYLKKCYISCFSERAMSYRVKNNLLGREFGAAIIIQKMIDPDYSGVIFTTNPNNNNTNEALIRVTHGVSHRNTLEDNSIDVIVDKNDGIKTDLIREKIVMSEDLIMKLYRMSQTIENSFDMRVAHDIEFVVKDDQIYIMQSRPMAEYLNIDKNKTHTVLDSSMFGSGLKGVTTPLTYSLMRDIFIDIQKQLLLTNRVPEDKIADATDSIEHAVCFYENKLYLRQNELKKIAALYEKPTTKKVVKKLQLLRNKQFQGLARLKIESETFDEEFEQITRPYINISFKGHTNMQMLETSRDLQTELLEDFAKQISESQKIQTNYDQLLDLANSAKVFEAEKKLQKIFYGQDAEQDTAREIAFRDIIHEIKRDERLVNLFTNTTTDVLVEKLHANSLLIFSKINSYINEFGIFGADELKLEAITAKENPAPVLLEIKNQLIPLQKVSTKDATPNYEDVVISKFHNIQKPEIKNLIETTKFLIENRHKLYEKQVRLCAIMRAIYLRIGSNFAIASIIHDPRDIFFLKNTEIAAIIEKGKYTNDEIQERIEKRKAEYAENLEKPYYECLHFYGAIQPENMIVFKSE